MKFYISWIISALIVAGLFAVTEFERQRYKLMLLGPALIEHSGGHPGTPLSVVRGTNEQDSLASVLRLSLRSQDEEGAMEAQPDFGPCLTFQARLGPGQPDTDLCHLCVRITTSGSAALEVICRDGAGRYQTVLQADPDRIWRNW